MNDATGPLAVLPEELEELPPGPELARLLAAVDRQRLSGRDRVRLSRARHRLISHQEAELLSDLYAVGQADDSERGDADPDGWYPWAAVEIAFALRWTRTAASDRLARARQLAEQLPRVQAALAAGDIDVPKVLVISELASWLDDDAARRVVDKVIDHAPRWTTGELRARLRRLVLAVDPQAARKRCAAAVHTRRVDSFDNSDGTGELWGRSLPPQSTAAAWERLTAIARAAKSAGDPRSMDQLRADALLDLLVGEGVAVGGPLTCHTAGLPAEDAVLAGTTPARPRPAAHPPEAAAAGPLAAAAPPAGVAGAEWDPAWPAEPLDRIGPHDVAPDPTGEPADRHDEAGRAFDGPHLWPPDWPGRWQSDPAVTAAGASPPDPAAGAGPPADRPVPQPASPQTASPQPAPRRGVIELQVPLTTLLRLADLPGELAGFGPVVADIARQVTAQSSAAQWRYSVYNKLGELVHHGTTRARPTQPEAGRRPTAEVAAFVRARNRTCIAPGCRRPSASCDLDHTTDWARGGQTTTSNLGPQCRLHHRFKHTSGAELIQSGPGVFRSQ